VSRRVPDAAVVVQIDEPSVPAVLAAQIATPSGYGTLRAVTAEVVSERLRTVLEVAAPGRRVVHCCADDVPIALFRSAGADAVSVDIARLDTAALDQLGEAVDDGASAWLGVVSTVGALPTAAHVTERVLRLWDRLAFDPGMLAERVVVTPACGLAGTTPNYARAVMTLVRQSAERLAEQ
jgi:methionine synthase II (cobalamin-independent)